MDAREGRAAEFWRFRFGTMFLCKAVARYALRPVVLIQHNQDGSLHAMPRRDRLRPLKMPYPRWQGNRVLTKQALKGSILGLAPLVRFFFFRVKQSSRTPAWSYSKARLAVLGCQENLELDCPVRDGERR
jgi:hypothetical protein